MSLKSHFSIFLFFLLGAALIISLGCNVSDVNKQNSISSGTTSGSGSSGGPAAHVSVTAANNTIATSGTTTITVIITDSQGRRTDATITLTSSRGGYFNGDTKNTILSGNTLGGILIVNYTAPSASIDDEITATVAGTNIKGSTIISNNSGTHQVTPSIGSGSGHGTIAPSTPQTVNHSSTVGFTVIANTGYTASVVGTCGGTLSGTTYTTNQITSDCTVIANFSTSGTHQVTPSVGSGSGTISPNTTQTVNDGSTATFAVIPTPGSGLTPTVVGTCGGTLSGTTFTTNAITSDCTVVAAFY